MFSLVPLASRVRSELGRKRERPSLGCLSSRTIPFRELPERNAASSYLVSWLVGGALPSSRAGSIVFHSFLQLRREDNNNSNNIPTPPRGPRRVKLSDGPASPEVILRHKINARAHSLAVLEGPIIRLSYWPGSHLCLAPRARSGLISIEFNISMQTHTHTHERAGARK